MTASRAFLILALTLAAGGSLTAGCAAWRSKQLTGEWMGDGLPSSVEGAFVIGILAAVFGLLLCFAWVVLVLADRSGLTRALNTPVLDDGRVEAKVGGAILGVHHALNVMGGLFVLVVVGWTAIHDVLAAGIVAATVAAVVALYLTGRKRIHSD